MPTFDHEIEISAPVEYVFEWGTTPENWMRCTPSMIDIEELETTDEGIRYRNTMKILGRTTIAEETYIVDEDARTTTSIFEDDDLSGQMSFSYTETDDGTRVRLHGDFDAGTSVFERVLQPVMTRYLNRQFRNTLQNMQDLIEVEYAEEQVEPASA